MESDNDDQEGETVIIAAEYAEDYESIGDEQLSMHSSNAENVVDSIRGQVIISTVQENQPSASSRGKYYKQTYRHAWEDMPDFQGWLRGVADQPTRAYCIYCRKTLHAHRLSLLKHTCTLRHQRAAQIHFSRKLALKKLKSAAEAADAKECKSEEDFEQLILPESSHSNMDSEDNELIISSPKEPDNEEAEEEDVDQNDEDPLLSEDVQVVKKEKVIVGKGIIPISTSVVDTVKGGPIANLLVCLYKLMDSRWTFVNEGNTNVEGRFSGFMNPEEFTPGRYKLHFDVGRYFQSCKLKTLYPFIEIVFDITSTKESYHFPLMVSPYGYSTNRGPI